MDSINNIFLFESNIKELFSIPLQSFCKSFLIADYPYLLNDMLFFFWLLLKNNFISCISIT